MNYLLSKATEFAYKKALKPALFTIDPEKVHIQMTGFGEKLGRSKTAKNFLSSVYKYQNPILTQKVDGIKFQNPIGLAAGFDYEAKLTQILPSLSFGFQTVGTITYSQYGGNERPMLGRLPKSKSLMVNKGFKNDGAKKTSEKLEKLKFGIPLGISIGRTNTIYLKTQKESIEDIRNTFETFEQSGVKNSYYELNISCPNLVGNITFYPPRNLDELLHEVKKLKIKKPIYIKMPIEKTDKETLSMLKVIEKYDKTISGVIFGNLQKNRDDVSLVKEEVAKFTKGYFSGKPTQKRSNELIALSYKYFGNKMTIVGCGGVFNAQDALEKITLGASLVQMITGLIYEGPQLVSKINFDLARLLKQKGFKNVSEAIGTSLL